MAIDLLCLDGDGIGPEIMAAAVAILDSVAPALGQPIRISRAEIGFGALEKQGCTITQSVIDKARAADGVVLGPVSHNAYPPRDQGGLNPSGTLRSELELFANHRPARTWPGLTAAAGKPFDLVVMRENLEGFYADRNMHAGGGEFMPDPDTALAFRKITRTASMNIARAAFELADNRAHKHVTAVHKANVMRVSDGLFLQCTRAVAADFPNVRYDEMLVDAAAAHLVRDPGGFDVIVTTNMFGDILSDLASELSGGLGLAGSLNYGARHAVAQAQHGSAPDIAGLDKANPVSLILSCEMLLRHLGEVRAADLIQQAVASSLTAPATRTVDLDGQLGTAAYAQYLAALITRTI